MSKVIITSKVSAGIFITKEQFDKIQEALDIVDKMDRKEVDNSYYQTSLNLYKARDKQKNNIFPMIINFDEEDINTKYDEILDVNGIHSRGCRKSYLYKTAIECLADDMSEKLRKQITKEAKKMSEEKLAKMSDDLMTDEELLKEIKRIKGIE